MAIMKLNFIFSLLASLATLAVSKEVHLQLGADNADLQWFKPWFGGLNSWVFWPKDGDVLKSVKGTDGAVLFAAGEHPVTWVFVNLNDEQKPWFTAFSFDGKAEHWVNRFWDGEHWLSAVDDFDFFWHHWKPVVAEAAEKKPNHFALDLANLWSDEHLELGFKRDLKNWELAVFKAKDQWDVVNEVKYGDDVLLENQGDNVWWLWVKWFVRGEDKWAFFVWALKDGQVKVKSVKWEDGRWRDNNDSWRVWGDSEANGVWKVHHVFA